jgi:hypothetical protein
LPRLFLSPFNSCSVVCYCLLWLSEGVREVEARRPCGHGRFPCRGAHGAGTGTGQTSEARRTDFGTFTSAQRRGHQEAAVDPQLHCGSTRQVASG